MPFVLGFLGLSAEGRATDQLLEVRTGPALCSASWVGDSGEVVTAYHCVVARRRVELRDRKGQVWRGRRVHLDRQRDIAILEVAGGRGTPGLEVRSERLSVGEPVVVWGHASASTGEGIPLLDGLLYYSRFGGEVSAVGPRMTQLDVAFNPGMSGGPVIDSQGRVVAVASRKMKGEHLSFASPLSEVWAVRQEEPNTTALSGQLHARVDLEQPFDIDGIPSVHLTPQLVLWDWLVAEVSVGVGLGQTREALNRGSVRWRSGRVGFLGRMRGGVGPQSVSLDLGPAWMVSRHLDAGGAEDPGLLVSKQGDPEWGAVAQVGWQGWTRGVSWLGEEAGWSVVFGVQLLNNLALF